MNKTWLGLLVSLGALGAGVFAMTRSGGRSLSGAPLDQARWKVADVAVRRAWRFERFTKHVMRGGAS